MKDRQTEGQIDRYIGTKTLQDLTGGIVQSFSLTSQDRLLTYQVDRQIDRYIYRQNLEGQIDKRSDRQIKKQIDRQRDNYIDGYIDRRKDRQIGTNNLQDIIYLHIRYIKR